MRNYKPLLCVHLLKIIRCVSQTRLWSLIDDYIYMVLCVTFINSGSGVLKCFCFVGCVI